MTMNKVMANKAKASKAAIKKLPKEVSVEAAAEAKLLVENGDHARGLAGANASVVAEDSSGGSSGGISPVVILGGLVAAGGIAAAAAGGGSKETIVQPVPVPAPPPPPPPAPTYSVTASATSVNEGSEVTFTIKGTNAAGNSVEYSLSGSAANAADLDSPVNGRVTLDANGQATVVVKVKADNLTETAEALNLVLSGGQKVAADVVVNDTSKTPDPAVKVAALTTGVDVETANIFNAAPVLVAGTGYLNTLNDTDKLTGVGVNSTLNVSFAASNDIRDSRIVQPTLANIQTINAEWTSNETDELNLADADTALKAVNITRITANNAAVAVTDIGTSVVNLSVSDSTRYGEVYFGYREDTLTGSSDAVTLTLNNARLAWLALGESVDWEPSDYGYGHETVNVKVTGASDIDYFGIQANYKEDAADEVSQAVNITADKSLEINMFDADGAESVAIQANASVAIAADPNAPLSASNNGIHTPELSSLTIAGAGNVTIDGLEGDVVDPDDEYGLTVDAGKMTGNLRLGIEAVTAADDLLSVTSGSGNDEIETYGALGGDIATNAGDDIVRISNGVSDTVLTDMAGTASVSTGAGNDKVYTAVLDVTATDKTDNGKPGTEGYDDVFAASISTGDGDDYVKAATLKAAEDWDNGSRTDSNVDDTYKWNGASISAGAGNDTIVLGSTTSSAQVAEGAVVDGGAGDDTVTFSVSGSTTVLVGDTDADLTALATDTTPGNTREVNSARAVDRLGAIVDLGAGSADVANFTETNSKNLSSSVAIVGRDAELRGAETVNVTAFDDVTVTTGTTMVDQDGITTGVQTDINANVLGTKTLNLTIANQVDAATAAATGATENDNNEVGATITADVLRFDAALGAVNLVSQEQVMLQNPSTEVYEAGTKTTFTLNNMREDVALSLTANEATGVDAGKVKDDSLLTISATTGAVTAPAGAADVTLNVDYASARDLANTAVLNVGSASGAFDLDLNVGATSTDTAATNVAADNGNVASTTDDDAKRVENFAVKFADANSHSIDANGFGDVVFRATRAPGVATGDGSSDVSSTAATSFTVWSAAGAGKSIAVDAVNADTIAFRNVDGTAVTAANVTLRVDASNNYTITTGSGADIVDMRADDVRADDLQTAVNRADVINLGAGRDTVIVKGGNNLSSHDLDLVGSLADIATQINDDVFETMTGVEIIMVDSASGASDVNDIVLNEAAAQAGVDTLRLVGAEAHTMRLVIGNDFNVAAAAGNGQLTTATSALVVDAAGHTGLTNLEIENKDDDSDLDIANLDIRVTSKGGADLRLGDLGGLQSRTEIRVTAQELVGTSIDSNDSSDADGTVDILVDSGEVIHKIVMVDTKPATVTVTDDAEADLTVVAEADWTGTAFEFDASALADTDANVATGGLTFSVEAGDTAKYTVSGTQNSDTITGSNQDDSLSGNAGDDTLIGGDGKDTLNGGVGDDTLVGEYIPLASSAVAAAARVLTFTFTDLDMTGVPFLTTFNTRISLTTENGSYTYTSPDIDNAGELGSAFQAFLNGAYGAGAATANATGSAGNYTVVVTFNTAHANFAQNLGALFSIDVVEEYTNDGVTIARAVTAAGSVGHIDITGGLKADVLTGGAGSDTFHFTVDKDQNMLSSATVVMDTITDLDLSKDTIELVEANVAGTAIQKLAIDSVLNNGAAINIDSYGDTLTQAVNDMFSAGREFGPDQTGIAALVQYRGSTYVVALGNQAQGQFGTDDYIINVTGYTGTLTTSNFNSTNDTITGDATANSLKGLAGNDTISGLAGNDTILGGTGNDTIDAGAGNDVVTGGAGNDAITLGAGLDTLVFDSLVGADTVSDFSVDDDSIQLSMEVFTALGGVGALTAAEFVSGTTGLAADASDRIIYNTTNGQLSYDADGNGTVYNPVLIATFTGNPLLTLADFSVIA